MTSADRQPPVTPPGHWVECPQCHEFFRNEQARGSHLHYVHYQSSIRAASQRRRHVASAVPIPIALPPPLWPGPAGVGQRPAPALPETPNRALAPESFEGVPSDKGSPHATPKPVSPPNPSPTPDPHPPANLSSAGSREATPESHAPRADPLPPKPDSPPAKAQESTRREETKIAPVALPPRSGPPTAADVLTAVGLSVAGLTALVLAKKGKNAPAPRPEPVYASARPPPAWPPGILAMPEPLPETTGNAYLDAALGYKAKRRGVRI